MKTKTDSKTQLINTAYRLFLTKSYNSTSTSLICEEASINKGTFYHFFSSKADLLVACIHHHTDDIISEIERIKSETLSGHEKLKETLFIPVKLIKERFNESGKVSGCLLGNITLELSTIDNKIRNEVVSEVQRIQRSLTPILEQYAEEEDLIFNFKQSIETIFSYLQGRILSAKLYNDINLLTDIDKIILPFLKSMAIESHDAEIAN